MNESLNEEDRIIKAYAKRNKKGDHFLYSFYNVSHQFMIQSRERDILNILRNNLIKIEKVSILDIGCDTGNVLLDFIKIGAKPKKCHGVDIRCDRIEIAKNNNNVINYSCTNAENLNYSNSYFDIILCFTVFSSILDYEMRTNIANEIKRVLKKDGIIIWYDFFMDSPKNKDVRGVSKKEIITLFSDCEVQLKRITLAPPLTRIIARYSVIACQLLEKIPFLCTHYIGSITKNK